LKNKPSFRKSERGQASSEFAIIMPFIICFYLIMLVAGLTWHAHDLNAQLALEGASREGTGAGAGVARVQSIAGSWMPGLNIGAITARSEYTDFYKKTGEYVQVVTQGVTPAWTILGIRANAGNTMGSAVSPVWEFVP